MKRVRLDERRPVQSTKWTGLPTPLKTLIEDHLTLVDFGKSFALVCKAFRLEWHDYRSKRMTSISILPSSPGNPLDSCWAIPPVYECSTFQSLQNLTVARAANSYRPNQTSTFQSILAMIYASAACLRSLDLSLISLRLDRIVDGLPLLPSLRVFVLDDEEDNGGPGSRVDDFHFWLTKNVPNLSRLQCHWSSLSSNTLRSMPQLRELKLYLRTPEVGQSIHSIFQAIRNTTLATLTIWTIWSGESTEDDDDDIESPLRRVLDQKTPQLQTLEFRDHGGYRGALFFHRSSLSDDKEKSHRSSSDDKDQSHMVLEFSQSGNGVEPNWLSWLPSVDHLELEIPADSEFEDRMQTVQKHLPRLCCSRLRIPLRWLRTFRVDQPPVLSVQHLCLNDDYCADLRMEEWQLIAMLFPSLLSIEVDSLEIPTCTEPVPMLPRLLQRCTVLDDIRWVAQKPSAKQVAAFRERWTRESNGIIQFGSCFDDLIITSR